MSNTRQGGAEGAAQEAAGEARRFGDEARERAESVGQELAHAAREEAERLGDAAQSRAADLRDGAARHVSNAARAFRAAADELDQGSPQERLLSQAARGVAEFADDLRGRDLGQITSDVGDFARRNPLAFLGGAALIGFAAARFARASQRGDAESGAPAPTRSVAQWRPEGELEPHRPVADQARELDRTISGAPVRPHHEAR